MCRCNRRLVKGSWHRAQGKTSAQGDVIDDPFRAPLALRLAPITRTSQ
jgi:hypothetical protein